MCPTFPHAPHFNFRSGFSFVFLRDLGGVESAGFDVPGVDGVGALKEPKTIIFINAYS